MVAKKKVDYDSLEPGWRTGIKSMDQLCAEHYEKTGVKVTRASLIKYFRLHNIPRDNRARIVAKAEAKVTRREALVTIKEEQVNKLNQSQRNAIYEEAVSDSMANTIIRERNDVVKARTIITGLWDEIQQLNEHRLDLAGLGELMAEPEKYVKALDDLYHKAISFPGRVDSGKKLCDALARLIELERDVYGIQKGEGAEQKRHDKITIRLVSPEPREDDE